jgi:hypothetical protein
MELEFLQYLTKENIAAFELQLAESQTVLATQKAFEELEAIGASDINIFNALANLFYERGELELSVLMVEAAYQCFQKKRFF